MDMAMPEHHGNGMTERDMELPRFRALVVR
jgi:hypothetical protein